MNYQPLKSFKEKSLQKVFVDWVRNVIIVDKEIKFNIIFINVGGKKYPYVKLPEMGIEPVNG